MTDDLMDMIEDCEKRHKKLNDWEQDFINSIFEKVINGLTDKQIETLEKIWERVTS